MTALRQRSPALKSNKLRQSARGQDCCFRISGICNGDPETTVLAHLQFEGGIMGGKAPDYSAAFACSACHEALDNRTIPPDERHLYMARAMVRTWAKWINKGLIVVSGMRT